MAASRARSGLLAVVLATAACMLLAQWSMAFVSGPQVQVEAPMQLRGSSVAAAGAAAAAVTPLAAHAADELVQYNMAGEFTEFFVVGYFGLTTAFTVISFLSYLILTKLKII
mmetsp:Transcript_60364/g.136037  ORF Transcript_60364/g.136037 Transcript_60364/m.136037 type:complete len:112 (-) Transcript_60364:155-490(-)